MPGELRRIDSYGKLDLRIGLASGNAEFYLWGDNLLDEQYDLYVYYFSSTAQIDSPARGRTRNTFSLPAFRKASDPPRISRLEHAHSRFG
ncbi:MAG: TonB-dependent receptor [Rhodocyclaceae bacterium]